MTNLFVLQSGDREVPFINRFGEDDSYLDEGDPIGFYRIRNIRTSCERIDRDNLRFVTGPKGQSR